MLHHALCLHLLLIDPVARRLSKANGFFCVGDVYIGVVDRAGQLEVEITQARGLTPKPGSKNIPGSPPLHMIELDHFIHITW